MLAGRACRPQQHAAAQQEPQALELKQLPRIPEALVVGAERKRQAPDCHADLLGLRRKGVAIDVAGIVNRRVLD